MPIQTFKLVAGNWTPNGVNIVTVAAAGNPTSKVGVAIAPVQLTAVDTDPTQTFTWSATGLPAGLAIAAGTGRVTGTPTTVSSASVIFTATDTTGAADTDTITWAVVAANVVTVGAVGRQTSTVGTAIPALPVTAVDSDATVTAFAWTATGLPAGLTISPTSGTITGTPTSVATTSATVTAVDPTGVAGTVGPFVWTVNAAGAVRFAGDPGVGRYYLGVRYYADDAEAWITAKSPGLGLSTERCGYNLGFNTDGLFGATGTGPAYVSDVLAIWGRGRIAQGSSSQGAFSYAELGGNVPASLSAVNASIDATIAWLRAHTSPTQIYWWSFQHEPDCSGVVVVDYQNFRDAQYHIASRIRAANLPYVALVKIYHCGSFWTQTAVDWRLYDGEWSGTAWRTPVFDAWATDSYNPSFGSLKREAFDAGTYKDLWAKVQAALPADVRPLIAGEMGIKSHDSIPDPKSIGGTHSWTLNELFRDLDDYGTRGRPVYYPGKQIISYDLWNSPPTGSAVAMGPFPKVDATNAGLNPNGWPDSGYNKWDDPDGVELVYTGTVSGGTFTLTYTAPGGGAQTTAAITANPTAAQVKTALEALSSVGSGHVYVNGTWNRAGGTLPLTVHWLAASAHYGEEMFVTLTSSVTGGGTLTLQHSNKRAAIRNQCAAAGRVKVFGAPAGSVYS